MPKELLRSLKIIGVYDPEWSGDPCRGFLYGVVRLAMPIIRQEVYVSVYVENPPEGVKVGDSVWVLIDPMKAVTYEIRDVSGLFKFFGKGRRERAKEYRIKCPCTRDMPS